MLEYLKQIKDSNPDVIMFLPGEEDNSLIVMGQEYQNPGTKIDGSEFGDCYHIILFKQDEETYDVKFLDKFEAILTSPLDYISMLIPDDWFGIVCRKTTTSDKFAKEAFDNIRENC
jgi:hypothetical protein